MAAPLNPLRISKWPFAVVWGLFVLVILYLGYKSPSLTPLLVCSITLAFASATVFAMLPYWLDYKSQLLVQADRESKVSDTLTQAILHAENLLARLNALERDASRSILIARQLPERLEEKLAVLTQLMDRQDTDRFTQLNREVELLRLTDREALEAFSRSVESFREALDSAPSPTADSSDSIEVLQSQITDLRKDLLGLMLPLKEQIEHYSSTPLPESFNDAASAGQLDKLQDMLVALRDDLQARFQSLSGRLDALDKTLPAAPAVKPPAAPKTVKTENKDGSVSLEFPFAVDESTVASDQIVLEVESVIGITHKVFLRGDEPWLSWDVGVPLERSGIGRWKWVCNGIKEPLKCLLLIDDEHEDTVNGEVLLKPGKATRVKAAFPLR
ncbi:MAG: hypothetical protein JW739_09025 [Opitutales bacterium]|nr:hypothetical protein [Opitutales bacterium]